MGWRWTARSTSLVARGSLSCDHETSVLRTTEQPFEPSHLLERELHAAVAESDGVPLATVRARCGSLTQALDERLDALGLTGRPSRPPFWVAMTAPVVGGMRIATRIGTDRPIAWLVVLCLAGVWLAFGMLPGDRQRTALGDAVLTRLRERHQPASTLPAIAEDSVASGTVALSVALFGLGVLANTELSGWSALAAAKASASNGGSGCSGGCGDSGGGCGGGCSGCGGGCGGCNA